MVKLPKKSLSQFIIDKFCVKLDSEEFKVLFKNTVLYLTNYSPAFTYQKVIKTYCKKREYSAKNARLEIVKSCYLSFNLKMFIMRLGKYDDISMEKLQHLTNEYGIYVCDSKRIKNLLSNSRELSTFVQTKVETTKIRDLKLDEMKRFFEEELYSTLLISAKFWTRKKLHFIVQSTNCDYADFHVELLEKALQTFYKLLPLDDSKPKEYVIAYLKKTIKNTTMNIINTHTSSKGGRKVNDGKYNFSLIVASENQLGLEQKVVFNEAFAVPCNPIPTFENKISVRQVLDVYQDRDSKYRFLCILLGNYDEQFTKWLKKNNIGKRNETNIEVQDRLDIDLYNRYIGEYLNFGRRHTNRFISSLKNQFGGSPQLIIGGNK